MKKERGIVLIFVVILIAIILISAVSIMTVSYREAMTTTAYNRAIKLRYSAESGLERGYFNLFKKVQESEQPDFSTPENFTNSNLQLLNYSYAFEGNQVEVNYSIDTNGIIKIKATASNGKISKMCNMYINANNRLLKLSKEFIQY